VKKEILMTALAITMLIACKKSDADPNPSQPAGSCTPVMDSVIRNGITSYTFSYSPNSAKISKFQNYDGAGGVNGYTQYTYDNNKIIERDYYDNGDPNGTGRVYHLDEKGRIKMSTYSEVFTSSDDTIFFQYDANGNNTFRIHKIVGTATTTDTIAYSYENNVRVTMEKIKNGQAIDRHEYEYTSTPDKVGYNEFLLVDIGQARIPGQGLFGSISPNLIAKDTYVDYINPNRYYTATNVYEFDSNGYPIKVTYDVVSGPGYVSFTDVATYKYVCR